MRRRDSLLFLVLSVGLTTVSCHGERAAANVLAKVNGDNITVQDYRRKMQEYGTVGGAESVELPVREKILNDLIERELLLDAAQTRNLLVAPSELEQEIQRITENYPGKEFEKMLASRHMTTAMWREELSKTLLTKKMFNRLTESPDPIPDAAIQKYYEEHKQQFTLPEQVRALHILVDSEQDGLNLLAQLHKGASFETLAREHSLGPEAQTGGDLGYFSRGVMPEIFDETIFSLEMGKVSHVVSSEHGYHLFKLVDRREMHTKTLEEATPEIRAQLTEDEKQRLYNNWLTEQVKKAKIFKNHELLAKLNF